jgi:hypothetical protein
MFRFTGRTSARVVNVKHVNSMRHLVYLKDDSVRFENKLPEFAFKVFAFPSVRETLWELFQRLDVSIELPKPTLTIKRRAFTNIKQGLSDTRLRLCRNNYRVLFHFSEIPCSLARASRNSLME